MTRLVRILGLLTFVSLVGCQQTQVIEDSSDLSQLAKDRFKDCKRYDVPTATAIVEEAAGKVGVSDPRSIFRNWSRTEQDQILQLMAAMPDEYISHLYKSAERGFRIEKARFSGSTVGLTQLGYYPGFARVKHGYIDYALMHELGHALDYYTDRHSKDRSLRRKNDAAYRQERNGGHQDTEGRRVSSREIGGYAKSDSWEWFAEGFESYYCSPKSYNWVQQKLPKTFRALSENLLEPRWKELDSDRFKILAYKPKSDPNARNHRLMVAAPAGFQNIRLCMGKVKECLEPGVKTLPYQRKRTLRSGMNVFHSTEEYDFSTGGFITVIGRDSSGKDIGDEIEVNPKGSSQQ